MFRKNEEKYGVTTSYTPEMEGYTTPLFKLNTPEYREREAKASRIAAEIEKSPTTQVRLDAENGDEEDKFSAVIRPGEQGGKYIPPMMRKKNQNGGKAQRATPPPTGARYNSHGSSNPPTPTSPYPGPPPSGSAGHSPVGVGGTPPTYQTQQPPQPLPNHAPAPAQHPPIHRNNSHGPHHSHGPDTKVNGDAKTGYASRIFLGSQTHAQATLHVIFTLLGYLHFFLTAEVICRCCTMTDPIHSCICVGELATGTLNVVVPINVLITAFHSSVCNLSSALQMSVFA
ncbi:Ataxin-2-like protein [Portunus trituberculatus]|uniref:Ataxin-2-like protein n=1 Tax=Portunus trituberculatus TaxID=210409 RepID=A0A5B7I8I2_PORTR|nr:Ataxin-2-like protein [Portunus trituberculatus]